MAYDFLSSNWAKLAPTTISDASVAMWNDRFQFKPHKIGVVDTQPFNFTKACSHFPVHTNFASFISKENKEDAIFEIFL